MSHTVAHYTPAELDAALAALPLRAADVVFVHSNLGFFGRPAGVQGGDAVCALFAEAILRRVGPAGAMVLPTFTYSFPRGEVFDPQTSASAMGAFPEWGRRQAGALRSVDPCYSVTALGGAAEALTRDMPSNSFGPGCFFARFAEADGVLLNLNFDAGSTFLHYLERELGVPYRFDKTFAGRVREGHRLHETESTIFVRYACTVATEPVFEPFHDVAVAAGAFVTYALGRGQMGCMRARDARQLLQKTLVSRPWLLTRAEALGGMPPLIPEPTFQALPPVNS